MLHPSTLHTSKAEYKRHVLRWRKNASPGCSTSHSDASDVMPYTHCHRLDGSEFGISTSSKALVHPVSGSQLPQASGFLNICFLFIENTVLHYLTLTLTHTSHVYRKDEKNPPTVCIESRLPAELPSSAILVVFVGPPGRSSGVASTGRRGATGSTKGDPKRGDQREREGYTGGMVGVQSITYIYRR